MILVILTIGLIVFIVGFLALNTAWQRLSVGTLGLIILVFAAVMMIGNDKWHWGMHQTTTTKTETLTSAVKNNYVDLLLYEPVKKSNTEKVYVYRTTDSSKRQNTAVSLKAHNTVKTANVTQAKLTIKTTRWTYDSSAWRWLYSHTGKHTTLVKTENTFTIPKSWATLSVSQAQWLQKQAKLLSVKAKTEMTATVTAQVKKAQTADPNMTAAEVKALTKSVEQKVAAQAKQAQPALIAKLVKQAQARSIH
ncbi:DUF4811 domain-containing protein [Lactiplantibacillus fabifermentans]|uniref:DUF4811 domain-containing protein n=2 Tax=Lactiplantibacillus fabifermentans TaxID=483011 RepID=A0A0R2NRX1_9LACO|nr:DUF4811 domain-containing protein [Lactiplantibacillus fabifermentans]ETY74881.1 hypothetical protein LFAB_05020 [Lactiplantibacillus fabifermentans T30PCM01]KRO28424.1 hypothetical protein DY78_GL002419 [Lactiplantibacillus fabifermentans DSM 21115]